MVDHLIYLGGTLCVSWTAYEIIRLVIRGIVCPPPRPRAWDSSGNEIPVEIVS